MRHSSKRVRAVVCLLTTLAITTTASAAPCVLPSTNNSQSFDTVFANNICNQSFIDDMWSRYSMPKSKWDDGLGFNDPCNVSKPLGRTFTAQFTLHNSMPSWDRPTSNSDMSGQALRWGGNYAAKKINKLEGRCVSRTDGVIANTSYGNVLDKKNKTRLFMGFFYQSDIIERAGTLLHEARHADGKGHGGGDGGNACLAKQVSLNNCDGRCSCDENFKTTSNGGANSYQFWYFADYANRASASSAMRNRAADDALFLAVFRFDDNSALGL